MHHYVSLPDFDDSYALIDDSGTAERAAIFVHGYLGDPLTTWLNFQQLVESVPWWRSVDLYFLHYDSFGASIADSADVLLRFTRRLLQVPSDWLQIPADSLPEWFPDRSSPLKIRSPECFYNDFLLIGHSQGGLVIRKTLLDLVKLVHEQRGGGPLPAIEAAASAGGSGDAVAVESVQSVDGVKLLQADLRLFAPALLGARPAGLLGLALRLGSIGRLAQAMLGLSRSFLEMQQGSNLLAVVREGTELFANRYAGFPALKADVLWAAEDNVVIDTEFLCDRNRGRADGTTHTSVCKPTSDYETPMRFVANGHV